MGVKLKLNEPHYILRLYYNHMEGKKGRQMEWERGREEGRSKERRKDGFKYLRNI